MANLQCTKCTSERKGFRRELDSWRHKLIHCVGFESILEGIYGPLLLRDLNLFYDCESEDIDDWSPEVSCSQCSFCKLPLDKIGDQVTAATPPLSSPSDYSPCQAPVISESSQSAHRFLHAVFHKKGESDVSRSCDSNIPLIAQELMKKMIRQFAMEYASKCLLHTNTNGVTRTSSPLSGSLDVPLDLTVSRAQEEKEFKPDPDGVLDLSNRNSACSAALSSTNHKASGTLLPSFTEELHDLGQRASKFLQSSALAAVLSSLCQAHQSLLHQILKLAHQEKLLMFRPVGQTESHSCHSGVNPQDNITCHSVPFCECKACNHSLCYPLSDCGHQSLGSTVYYPGDSDCTIHHYSIKDCNGEGQPDSNYGCVQRCRMETYSVLCSKSLPNICCQSLTAGHINVCSCASSPSLSQSSSLCTSSSLCHSSSICCKQHNPHSCPHYPHHVCATQVKKTVEEGIGDGDPPCPVLKREQSPSPPPLSPIPSDISKTDEKPPSLLHHQQEEKTDLVVNNINLNTSCQKADVDAATDDGLQCEDGLQYKIPASSEAKHNPSATSLQDVVNRFSEKLETIKPVDKDSTMISTSICVSEKEQVQSPSTSQNLQFPADAHLTEIITTVLHTGSGSDYNLSELFNRQENREPKSPNTRFRRRQEVLTALATPTDDASTRRHTLQIKRELAMLDQSCNRRKVPLAKKARLKDENVVTTPSNPNLVKDVSKRETEVGVEPKVWDEPLNLLLAVENDKELKEEIKKVIVTEEVQIIKAEEQESEISSEEKNVSLSEDKYDKQDLESDHVQTQVETLTSATPPSQGGSSCEGDSTGSSVRSNKNHGETPLDQNCETDVNGTGKECHSPPREKQKCQSDSSKESRRSRRTIVPPQRFSSYVTEPRKMFFVACFSENIFNHGAQKDREVCMEGLAPSTLHASSKDSDSKDTQIESRKESSLTSHERTESLNYESTQKEHGLSPRKSKDQCQITAASVTTKEKRNPKKHSSDSDSITDGSNSVATSYERLRSSPKRLQLSKMLKNQSNRDVNNTCVESLLVSRVGYTSPIKLMFVSPVTDKEGVKYSLKSAGCGSGTQAVEHFDPCEESSWSGTPQKHKNQSSDSMTSQASFPLSPLRSATSRTRSSSSPATLTSMTANSLAKSASSPVKSSSSMPKSSPSPVKSASSPAKSASSSPKSASSPAKSASSPPKSASSPAKSSSSPPKSASSPGKSASSTPRSASLSTKSASSPAKMASLSLKSACSPAKSISLSPKSTSSPAKSPCSPRSGSSSPKNSSRRCGEGTPSKRVAGTESQGSLDDLPSFHETTPQKRRPGRPKKLGPQLEKKIKRPIGRPRKQKSVDLVPGTKTENGKSLITCEVEENINKNLKITVVFGRSRRNKRLVSEGFDQLQTEFSDACQAVGLKRDLGVLLHNSKTSSGSIKAVSEELSFASPLKEPVPQSTGTIKCQKRDDSAPSRKPGRPAKVKISGISVTVTTLSPRQRKIQIDKDPRQSSEIQVPKKVLLPEFKSAKGARTISNQLTSGQNETKEGTETNHEGKDENHVAVRHSMRVRKPSIHFLHAVATSTVRSYSRSNALLRRSKQLLLTKASNERKQEEQLSSMETAGKERQLRGQGRVNTSQDLSRVAGVSVDSIFAQKETIRWWAASTEEKMMKQELARRIRVISNTWVSDTVENQEKGPNYNSTIGTKENALFTRKSKHSSVVRTLFDCPPNKPRSCSMQQICSWFMQTTETQSLAIVKKASSRNPYELMHFPRSANKKSICHSPQAERLRKHIKKFAKTVPKSPLQHQQAQRQLKRKKVPVPAHSRRQLFTDSFVRDKFVQADRGWKNCEFGKYQATLLRARIRFLTQKERTRWQKKQRQKKNIQMARCPLNGHVKTGVQPKCQALYRSANDKMSDCLDNTSTTSSADQTQEPMDVHKEGNICSKAFSPERLKECRVFLRKINSPDNESAEEEWDSCTVTLDDGSYLFAERERELVGVVKAVKTERKRSPNKRTASREHAASAPKSAQEQDAVPAGRKSNKRRSPRVVSTESPQPPPAKIMRQSRMRGLSGPRWCDFVFEN
ncbi:uncharacterized protein lcorl isoform X1 [Parambassis ranga]|uniref:Uncharacterized protein lcorl isoform X1 n=1 Tax=Parambassis ranga TaxID=210632 RepID=A0A6P7I6M9_9TELE|nr:ligand-dependent nuclear receptor corepressor-like protein isoform X1 [Parambassis ranga]